MIMNAEKISKLEKNVKLKTKIFGKNIWKNYAIIPPSLVMFTGLVGAIYLLNSDQLISLYVIPFVAIFLVGTIWLKATQKFLISRRVSENEIFRVCMAIPIFEDSKKSVLLFSTGNNRNNKYYLEKEKKELLNNTDIETFDIKNNAININNEDLMLVPLPGSSKFAASKYKIDNIYWILYTGNQKVDFLTQTEINRYS